METGNEKAFSVLIVFFIIKYGYFIPALGNEKERVGNKFFHTPF